MMFCLNNRTTLFDHDDFETTRLLKSRPPDYEIPILSRVALMYCIVITLITLVGFFKKIFHYNVNFVLTNIILFIISIELLLIISKINLFIYFVYLLDDGFDYHFYKNLYY